MAHTTLTVGLLVDHAKAARIPLFIIFAAAILTLCVDQIWEFFLLLTTEGKFWHQFFALLMTALAGLAVWHTTRTVYRFNVPTMPTLSAKCAEGLRDWAPRFLGALVPSLMAVGSITALNDPALKNAQEPITFGIPILFGAEAIVLFLFFVGRRHVFTNHLTKTPSEERRVEKWRQLPKSIRISYGLIFAGNVLALVLATAYPGLLSRMGPLALVLLCASLLTFTGTYLTIQAARWQFPLLSALFILAVAFQSLGWNDNHRVRLYSQMHSSSTPRPELIDTSAPLQQSFSEYVTTWKAKPRTPGPIYLVSAEGGGIRAAAWTALVLSELELRSDGQFSKHMLLGSGVSGGSLGLAWFAAIVKAEQEGVLERSEINAVVKHLAQADYLGPALETTFLTDFLQRFWPRPVFIDRGERLEAGWEAAWSDACHDRVSAAGRTVTATVEKACSAFGSPWKNLWAGTDEVPLLFLNSTDVMTGERYVQQPLTEVGELSAAILSTGSLPASSPLSSVVHNSARFTYISPAGSLITVDGTTKVTRQFVDGGYFENSGTTTLVELAHLLAQQWPACSGQDGFASVDCPIRIIHISNDPEIESLRSDDSCKRVADVPPSSRYGEIRAPVMALLNTRDARAAVARANARGLFNHGKALTSSETADTDAYFFHFRLCKGLHHLPLGWTLSAAAWDEMQGQLGIVGVGVTSNHSQVESIARLPGGPAQ